MKIGDLIKCKFEQPERLGLVLDVPKEDGSVVQIVWLKAGLQVTSYSSLVEIINESR